MSGLQPIAFWGLQVPAGDQLTMVASEIPGVNMFRITMAAIDPNAKPLEADQPKRATLKLIRRPLDHDDYEDDEDDEDESADEEELKKIQKKSKKLAKKGAQANQMEVDGEDSDEEEDSDDEGFETEEFVICTLDPERQYQQTLDIVVGEYEEAFFKVVGNFDVFLSGNYVVPADRNGEKDDEDDSEDEDEDEYDLSPDEDELMNMLGGGVDDSEDELDDIENPRITEIDSEDEKKEIEPKLTKAGKKSLKRAAEEEGRFNSPTVQENRRQEDPERAEKAEKAGSPATKKVVQGVTIEDKKTGTGPVAKNGVKLGMRYIGKLNNGKVFDSNTKGKPFTFRLGKGEVIKGWDVGLVGMQVGGERRIVIPANMAYGKKQLPGIPANSTLTFDVKLLEVK
ncbi:hypothetical protein BDD12DRAFT_814668 [Trichophaea hybrida]|nr:hypothetical protein BDD12DRAFT_814668 [Trichophaea hybrida]